uniref:Uncharacterized protein n=1 Tax=Panagrolaimus sp. PS1159 TaxID=55785 RepID=A0AC35GV36_9BILA
MTNYDALLTLTNLASVSDSFRKRIIKVNAVPKIEEYWYMSHIYNMTNHDHLRAVAAECLLNLLFLDEFYDETVASGTDRLKLWFLYCAEEDERLALVSSAGFAILTRDVKFNKGPTVLMGIANMIESDEKVASEIVANEMLRVLVAITKLKNDERVEGRKEALHALKAAEEKWNLIKPTHHQLYERLTKLSTLSE